jgi:glycine cleavage system H protein
MVPADLRYTKDHEWVRVEGDQATVGVTDFAASQLGDVVFVDLPASGRQVNPALADHPELVNSDPYGEGWMIRLRVADGGQVAGLLEAPAYEQLISES